MRYGGRGRVSLVQQFDGSEQVFHKGELTQLQQSSLECNKPRCRTRKKVGVLCAELPGFRGHQVPRKGTEIVIGLCCCVCGEVNTH